jgi:uncharacterized protein
VRRRALLAGLAAAPLAGCMSAPAGGSKLWHGGELTIGTGNTTGVYYVLGAGFAYLINKHLSGYDAVATPTTGSIENVQRLSTGDIQVTWTLAGVADDAYAGSGNWTGRPQPVRALARTYNNYEHVIARVDSGITTVADMRGHKVSLGSPGSGTELIGKRLIAAAGLDPARDLTVLNMSLTQTANAMVNGSISAMVWSGGIPTPGISDLFAQARNQVRFVQTQDLAPKVDQTYPNLLDKGTIPKTTYGLPEDVPVLTDANLLVVRADIPNDLAFNLTKLLFDYQQDLVEVHQAASGIRRETAPATDPIPLHPGAQRYYTGS